MMQWLKTAVFSLGLLYAGQVFSAAQSFPVLSPACIALFDQSMVSLPYVQAIDIARCQQRLGAQKTKQHSSALGDFYYLSSHDPSQGYYAVKRLAADAQHAVLLTQHNTGGSGVFAHLLFVHREHRPFTLYLSASAAPDTQERDVLLLDRLLIAGDRCQGGIKSVRPQGRYWQVSYFDGKTPTDCHRVKQVIVAK